MLPTINCIRIVSKCLYCFVYNPDGYSRNPRGVEKDLQALDKEPPVKVFIRLVH